MNDWYEILGVSPEASQEEITAAYERLVPRTRPLNESEDEAETRRLREYAYGILGNPERRAAFDAERSWATGSGQPLAPPPQQEPASASPAPSSGRGGGVPLGPLIGVVAVVFAIVAVGLGVFLALEMRDGDGEAYPDREDSQYDLEAMRLRDEDLPPGFAYVNSVEFDNEEWVQLFFTEEELQNPDVYEDDFVAKQRQLEAEGRLRNLLAIYQPSELGRTLGIFSMSTLYTDDESASRSLDLFCGLPIDQRRNVDTRALTLPRIGDESTGFVVDGVLSNPVYNETTYCFRTGRVVHTISLASLPQVEDIALAVRLAERMESNIAAFYNGKSSDSDDGS